MNNIDILEEIKNKFNKTMKIIVLGEHSTLVDNSIFDDLAKLINISEALIAENKELKEVNNILKEKIITIRNYVKPYTVWYDSGTKNYNLKGCSKQEIYKTFSKIRSEVKGEYIFLKNDKYLQSLLEKE